MRVGGWIPARIPGILRLSAVAIERSHPNTTFPDGTPVAFPTPELTTERYDLDEAYPGLVQEITANVGALTMARYRPSAYRLGGAELSRESSLGALLQSAVLKRFESCWQACLLTLDRMIEAHDVFLSAWDAGRVLTGRTLREAVAADLDESDSRVLSAEVLRAELQRAASEGEIDRAADLPWGIGAAFAQGPGVPSVGPSGIFFACRTRHGDRYWRYVAADGEITSTEATILRRIDPGFAPGVDSPAIRLEEAWSAAVASILEEHNATSTEMAGTSLGAIQGWALGLLDDPNVSTRLPATEAYEALSIERGGAVRQALGAIKRELDAKAIDPIEAAQRIIDAVAFYGLTKVDPPEPRQPITEEDIGVVCWMAVLSEHLA